jgi:magnesium-transporting ATPase (P-type)
MRQDTLDLPGSPHALPAHDVLAGSGSGPQGLTRAEASARLVRHGRNALPRPEPPGLFKVFLRQFLSPLIYILMIAAAVSLLLGDWSDAAFIAAVLLVNAVIGGIQEYGAERSAEALRALVASRARVIRDGEDFEIDAEELVPGDVVLIESGMKIPADLRLLSSPGLEADESLLTGESLPVAKDADRVLNVDAAAADRVNMAFAGTLATRGRASGVVVSTGIGTRLGDIATSVAGADSSKPPLLVRMDRFTKGIALAIGVAVIVLGAASLARELGFADRMDQVVTGPRLGEAAALGESAVDDLIRGVRVFARVEPQQKLEIVRSLMRLGHFVAVTGDGANDAPALGLREVLRVQPVTIGEWGMLLVLALSLFWIMEGYKALLRAGTR